MTLNEAQRRAVEHEGPPLVVLAGPGTGKTRVIVERVAHLVRERGAEPERIVAITFTNKAAAELRARLAHAMSFGVAERVFAGTFHAWALRTLRRFGDRLPIGREPQLIDSAQQRRLLTELILASGCLGDLPAGVPTGVGQARGVIAALRHAAITPARAESFARETTPEDDAHAAALTRFAGFARLFALYDAECLRRGWATFDDLLTRPAELIAADPLAASIIRSECAHVVVDEFQDVNTAQIQLLAAICPPQRNPDLAVVGDDDQSIYAFRGADDRAMHRFVHHWPGAVTIPLTQTYRSAPAIVRVAQSVITRAATRFAPDKRIEPAGDAASLDGPRVEAVRLGDNNACGEVIATMIGAALAALPEDQRAFSRFAVIGRTWTELSRVRAALELAGIPIITADRAGVLADQGVQDLLAWVNLLCNPASSCDARRLLVRPPIAVPHARALAWEQAWRCAASRRDARPFADWVIDEHTDDPEHGAAVRRFAAWRAELTTAAGELRADEALAAIIRTTGLVHADLPAGRARSARVSAVVAVLRFARERIARLEQPRDLGAFLRYYADLDAREQGFATPAGEEAIEAEECVTAEDAARAGAVAVMTAHGSKGLEFDTVFVPGLAPRNNWPDSRVGDDPLPDALTDRLGDDRSPKERQLDEERRLFYVACTRAKSRLVLLGQPPASAGATNFLVELLDHGDVTVRTEAAVLDQAGHRDAVDRLLDDYRARQSARDALDDAARAARLDAAEALARAADAHADPAEPAAALADSARRLAAIEQVRSTGQAPAWAGGAVAEMAAALVARLSEAGAAPAPDTLPGLRAPLDLSFSHIDAYERCPRCAYVAQVLGLGDADNDAIAFGRAMHRAMQDFYQRWADADNNGHPTPTGDDLVALARDAVERHWPDHAELDPAALHRAEAQARLAWQSLHDPETHVSELERKVTFPYDHAGATHTITAKLDRIDLAGPHARIIDYKTGNSTKDRTEPKALAKDLQMGIYVMALRHFRQDPDLDGACEYWFLSDGLKGRIPFSDLDLDKVRARINKAIEGMLAGHWPRSPDCARRNPTAPCSILDRP